MSDYVFPSVETEAKKVLAKVDGIVNLLNEVDTIKEDIKAIQEDAEDKLGIPKPLLMKYAKAKYDKNKFLEKLEETQEIADNLSL